MPRRTAFLLLCGLLGPAPGLDASASVTDTLPKTIRVARGPYMPASGMSLGARLFGRGEAVSVRFIQAMGFWANQLAFMHPRTLRPDTLFTIPEPFSWGACPAETALTRTLGPFGADEEIVFRLETLLSPYPGRLCTGEACGPRYSGRNSPAHGPFHSSGPHARFAGHPWAAAIRLDSRQIAALGPPCTGRRTGPPEPEGVLLAFNDGADEHPNDFLILVSGVELETERLVEPPRLEGKTPFTARTEVRLSALPAASAREATESGLLYTLDGTDPAVDAGGRPLGSTLVYSLPFTVTATTRVKARAWLRLDGAIRTSGMVSRDFTHSPPPLPGTARSCRARVQVVDFAPAEPFAPRPIRLPISVVLPRSNPKARPAFLDQPWRVRDPSRPDESHFPDGPVLEVTTPGPFAFNLGFYSQAGEFLNRARGEVTAEMLAHSPAGPGGERTVGLLWYPATAEGRAIATGAIIVKGEIRTQEAGSSRSCPDRVTRVLSTFGYLRR